MDRFVVTGGSGFIGKHLVKKLRSMKPSSIAIISNAASNDFNYISDKIPQSSVPVTFYNADIRQRKAISEIFLREKADTCIHLAAKVSVADSIKNPQQTMDVNVNGTLSVLDACYNSRVKNFIFASSAAVYGDVTGLPIAENQILRPLSPYGSSKMLAELHALSYTKLKKIKNAVILRIFNVYGHGQTSETDVISRFFAKLSKGLPPIIHGDGKQTRDFVSIDDVVEGFLVSIRLLEHEYNNKKFPSSPVFNIGTGMSVTIKEAAQKMIEILNLQMKPIHVYEADDNKGILHSCADVTKAKKDLKFVAKKNLDTGLREMLEQKNESHRFQRNWNV